MNTAILKKEQTGEVVELPMGGSWLVFLFGWIISLSRGDGKYTAIMLLLAICTLGFSNIYFAFKYNEIYFNELVAQGYTLGSSEDVKNAEGSKYRKIRF